MAGSADVVVVGSGLAGLACALELHRRGLAAEVIEVADGVGGRVRTDVVDGFRCDRGFQLLNPSYPAVRALVDVPALGMRRFGRGVEVLRPDGSVAALVDPLTRPRALPATVRGARGLVRPGEAARLARWAAPSLGSVRRLLARPDARLGDALDTARVDGELRSAVLEPFLTGTLATDPGEVSERFVRLLLRSFVLATPGVPAEGMQALPDQLAARLPARPRTGTAALEVRRERHGVRVETSEGPLAARAAVVATDAIAAARLTGSPDPGMHGLATWWLDAPGAPATDLLRVDGTRSGPVVNTAVVSAAAPTYAPPGRSLVQATTLHPGPGGQAPAFAVVREHLRRLWGDLVDEWRVVRRHDVPRALPRLPVPLVHRRPVHLGDGLLVAGDHRDTASIQGALVSGRRAAAAAAAHLGVPEPTGGRP